MKKLWTILLTGLLLTPLFLGIGSATKIVSAQETDVEFILHKRIYRDVRNPGEDIIDNGGLQIDGSEITEDDQKYLDASFPLDGAMFDVYDATEDFYAQGIGDIEAYVTKFAEMTQRQGLKEANENDRIEKIREIQTGPDEQGNLGNGIARITLPSKNDGRYAAYLFIETGLADSTEINVDLENKAQPIMVVLPIIDPMGSDELTEIHIYPKNVGYVRDPYFFKYGVDTDNTERPLAGAKFAFYQKNENGDRLYLDINPATDLRNNWIAVDDPAQSGEISIFESDENGLVTTGQHFFPSGTYYFEEIETAPGFVIDEAAREIKVEIPASWRNDEGEFQYVMVNGQPMEELISGMVPEGVTSPRVLNHREDAEPPVSPTQPGDPGQPSKPGFKLPQTGEAKSFISLIGILILGVVAYFWYRRKKATSE